ncbi:PhnA protein [Bifidobacterium sp. DSM 109960]|uniref:PhnA protein n=1 Tax=Bifidobacterium erythrocebi TaxID=2675325 RepID=A0A7Y0HTL1_9BIFI|nr:hypothetical protein [Bifidobacterium sp. DSM 109960]NMM96300.1 PhnA protein [Bifidobacterium sp. DSM 109960]
MFEHNNRTPHHSHHSRQQAKLKQALAAIHDGDEALLAIARKQCRITAGSSGHGVRTVAPLPINLGAWQLSQDIDALVLRLARAVGLPTGERDTVWLSWALGQPCNIERLFERPDAAAIVALVDKAARRMGRFLEPEPDRTMIGRCLGCDGDLWAEQADIDGGWIVCESCGREQRVRDVAEARVLRLAACGATGTAAELAALLGRCGVRVRRGTISKWKSRGIIRPVGDEGGKPTYLLWDIWKAVDREGFSAS